MNFWPCFPIHSFRHFFTRTYRFATIQNVTDRQTTADRRHSVPKARPIVRSANNYQSYGGGSAGIQCRHEWSSLKTIPVSKNMARVFLKSYNNWYTWIYPSISLEKIQQYWSLSHAACPAGTLFYAWNYGNLWTLYRASESADRGRLRVLYNASAVRSSKFRNVAYSN